MSERQFHHVDPAKVEQVLEQRRTMTDEQKDMVRAVTAPNQFAVVVGDAGTGKSFSMGAAREIWEHSGYNVRGLALAGKAAEELQHGSGIESGTLASFELRLDKGFIKLTDRDILVIDESGMVGAKQLDRVLREAESAGAKVVWAGDSKQLEAIHAGAAHRTVTERLGASELTEVQRQKQQWQKDAGYELARRDFKTGLDAYNERGFVHMPQTQDETRAAMVRQYMNDRGSLNSSGETASLAVTAHRNADVLAFNKEIRNAIKERGELADGMKVQTEKGEREFADGDRLLFLKNDRELGVKNGSLGTVERAADGAISVKLDSGKSVQFDPAKYRNFDHGYAFTIHKTQGASVDKAYAFMSPSNNHALSYVAMTRHKDELHVYGSLEKFQSYEQMAERLGKRQVKESTLDYAESAAKLQAKREQERAAEKGAAPAQESKQSAALSALGNRSAESSKLKQAWANLEAENGQGSKLEQAKAKWKAEIEAEKGQGTQLKRKQAWANQEKSQQEPKQRERDQGHEM
jgi:Ti-type conjugative transfer relaxase TraA